VSEKEATARIKINKLLEAAGWRFFPDGGTPANIRLESSATITSTDLDALGENFEKAERGFVDLLLLDARGFPLIVLEAKAEDKNPLSGKEQARKYARSQNCRFVIRPPAKVTIKLARRTMNCQGRVHDLPSAQGTRTRSV